MLSASLCSFWPYVVKNTSDNVQSLEATENTVNALSLDEKNDLSVARLHEILQRMAGVSQRKTYEGDTDANDKEQ